jgi:hypothetical protein
MSRGRLGRHAVSIGLVASAAGLALAVLWDRGRPTSSETEARRHNLVKAFRRDEVDEIALERDGETLRIVRRTEPDAAAGDFLYHVLRGDPARDEVADQVAVDRLVQTFEFASPVRAVEPASDRKAIGLESPRVRATLRMGKLTYRVALGAEAPTPSGAAYASLEGPQSGTFVMPRDFALDLLRPLDTYRSRTIVPYLSTDLDAIELDGAGGARRFVRGPWGGFRLARDGAGGPRVGRAIFDQLLSSFASIRLEKFTSEQAARASLAAATERVTIRLRPSDPSRPAARLELGGECTEPSAPGETDAGARADAGGTSSLLAVLRTEPTPAAGCAPSSVMVSLRIAAEAFADRRLLASNADEAEELVVNKGDRALELARQGDGWHMRRPEDRYVPAREARGLVEGLLRAEGEILAAPDLGALGLVPPRSTLLVRRPASGEQDRPEESVQVGEPGPDGSVAVRRAQDGVVLSLPRASARLLEPSANLVRSPELIEVPAERVRKVSADWGDGDKQVVVRTATGFELEAPAGFAADGSLAVALFDGLAHLAAERWVAERDDGSYGLAKPRATALLELADDGGVSTRRLLLGDAAGEGAYGRFEPDTGVFVVSRGLEETLRSYAIDRTLFMMDPSEVRGVRIRTEKKTIALVGKGGKLEADASAGGGLSSGAVAKIERALVEMRAEGVAHLGPAAASEGFDRPLVSVQVLRQPGRGERSREIKFAIGRADVWRHANVYWARREGADATFAMASSRVKVLLEGMSADQGGGR